MKLVILSSFTLLLLLPAAFCCMAQQGQGESRTAAGKAFDNFDTVQVLSDVIPNARKFKSPDLLKVQISGTPKQVTLKEYNYLTNSYLKDGKNVSWGIYAIHEAKIQGGHLVTPQTTYYTLLNMPALPYDQGWSYNLTAYRKDHLKIADAKGEETFVIDYFDYSTNIDSAGKLIKENAFGKYFYNEKGDCVRIITNMENRQFRYFYQYDYHGNWIQRFVWDSDYGIIQKIDRVITY